VKRVLVTGAGSFTARHLLALLARETPAARLHGSDVAPCGVGGVEDHPCDLTDPRAARALIEAVAPDLVYHLAGVSARDAETCLAVNLGGTRHLLEACAARSSPPAVVVVSTAAVYGLTRPDETPVRESTPLRPITSYGASKAAAELLALSMHRRRLLPVVVVRPFNLVGPGLRAGFAPSDFLAQALAIRDRGAPPELRVGNLDARRDFVDVRDAVRAYRLLATEPRCQGEAWNVATGRGVPVRDLLAAILRAVGVTPMVVADPARRRPVEVLEQSGDAGALARATGWTPEIALERSLRDMAAVGR